MPNNNITVSELPDPNCTYIVNCDGIEYECIPSIALFPDPTLGNLSLADPGYSNTNEPFLIGFVYNNGMVEVHFLFKDPSIDHTVSIDKVTTSVKPLDTILSKRIINFTVNPYTTIYKPSMSMYANIDANLSPIDLVSSIVSLGRTGFEYFENINSATVVPNGMFYLCGYDSCYIYNPYSGYVMVEEEASSSNCFDISSVIQGLSDSDFYGALLLYENSDPVICNFVYYNEDDDEILLSAAEPVLKDSNGDTIHDFRIGPIVYVTSTGEFIYGDTSWPSAEDSNDDGET